MITPASILGILNQVNVAIFTFEQFLPFGGNGATKKQLLLNTVEAGLKFGESAGAANPLLSAISTLVDLNVGILNQAGVFNHGQPVPLGGAIGSTGAGPQTGSGQIAPVPQAPAVP